VKISEGCNNRCSYCTIPSIRGNLKSRKKEDILSEIKNLLEQNVKEIINISQDTTKYGIDIYGKPVLIELLSDICKLKKDFFVRLLYLNPDGIDTQLIDFVKNERKMIKYFEIPVQHVSNSILKKMNRKSDYNKITKVFKYIRENITEAIIRTTFIVGFPGETEDDFEKISEFLDKFKPDFAGFFPFYKEDGVPASNFPNQIPKSIKRSRISKLQKLQKKITSSKIKSLKKEEIICFVDKENDDFEFILEGRALFQAPEIDGKAYFIEGAANKGFGPYKCKIKRFVYPDIYCKIIDSE
jgi:ribosomal protein S12 methylthiotransferase